MSLDNSVLALDEAREVDRIARGIRGALRTRLHRRGLVVAISGGVDSAVCAALAVRAIGKDKVFGLLLPETDSSSASVELATELVQQLGIESRTQNIAPALEAIGCYQ